MRRHSFYRTGNPALKKVFQRHEDRAASFDGASAMTIQGTVNKTAILLSLVVLSFSFSWANAGANPGLLWLGLFGGMIAAFVTIFKKEWAPTTAPIYALLEGLVLGAISVVFEKQYPGIVVQAVSLTFGVLFALLMAYKSGFIKATENFKLGVVAATGGICIVYFATIILSFFGISISFIHDSSPIGIGFSLFVVIIASLNLVLDFDFIEQASEQGAPKYFEWYGAFALLLTLVWLYLEILRLLAKMQRR